MLFCSAEVADCVLEGVGMALEMELDESDRLSWAAVERCLRLRAVLRQSDPVIVAEVFYHADARYCHDNGTLVSPLKARVLLELALPELVEDAGRPSVLFEEQDGGKRLSKHGMQLRHTTGASGGLMREYLVLLQKA